MGGFKKKNCTPTATRMRIKIKTRSFLRIFCIAVIISDSNPASLKLEADRQKNKV
jgi:hypothetical protein